LGARSVRLGQDLEIVLHIRRPTMDDHPAMWTLISFTKHLP
jgi:hypothetical protein